MSEIKPIKKTSKESLTILTNLVMPSETNEYGNMFGGELLSRIDRACFISASKHCGKEVVTASVNKVSFLFPIPIGSIVTIEAKVSRAFSTSMEVIADIWIEQLNGDKKKVSEAIYTFACLKKKQEKSFKIPELIPETPIEKERFEDALVRREISLLWVGKIEPSDAYELKKFLLKNKK